MAAIPFKGLLQARLVFAFVDVVAMPDRAELKLAGPHHIDVDFARAVAAVAAMGAF
jgi:hypothetical protein